MSTSKTILGVLVFLVASALVLSGCGRATEGEEENDQEPKKQVSIQTIETQNSVVNELRVSGSVVPKQYSVIRSLTPGTVEFLSPVGSDVFTGQPLFSIRDSNIENSFRNAQSSLDQTIVIGTQRVQQVELQQNSAEASLALALSNLDIAKKQSDQNVQTSRNAAALTYSSAYSAISQALVSLSVGGIEDTGNNASHFRYAYRNLQTSDAALRARAETQVSIAIGYFRNLSKDPDLSQLEAELDTMHLALVETKKLVDQSALLLQLALVGADFTQASLDAAKLANTTNQTLINQFADSVIRSKNTLSASVFNSDLAVDQAENQLELAEIQFNNAQISLNNARDGASLERSISQSQFDAAAYSYSNLTLPSPFSGKILSHFVNAGEQVSVGRELIEVGDISIVEIAVDVDVDFAEGLAQGDAVVIDSDINGFISELEPIGNITSGKVGVVVQASNANAELVAGDIVDVHFTLNFDVDELIIIPIKAATIEETETSVFVIENGVVVKRTVTLGKVFGNKVSVPEGLSSGDMLILPSGIFITVGEEVEPQ